MTDFAKARLNMVNAQLLTNGVHDPALVEVYRHLPRETLVDAAQAPHVYRDEDLPLPGGRWMLEPLVEARMIQAVLREPVRHALVIGAATLSAVAVLARFVPGITVVEPDGHLRAAAQDRLCARDGVHVTLVDAPLQQGAVDAGPYDAILIPGAVSGIPMKLLEQLAPHGQMVCVLRETPREQGRIVSSRRAPQDGAPEIVTLYDAATPYMHGFAPEREFVF
ncbi:MAG: hypothetical protein H6865_07285 [Rhodospirillales bacterium]|nr:hypothetical protein [Alphaproteobacteria bacterium]MCB9987420.1 hypothetical protein [Rhodospirillales bacterium]USO07598.1 MAG: hypothetical protein H6866_09370 [Rhodospirillales bacterium]